jgi:hypothetical protein
VPLRETAIAVGGERRKFADSFPDQNKKPPSLRARGFSCLRANSSRCGAPQSCGPDEQVPRTVHLRQ